MKVVIGCVLALSVLCQAKPFTVEWVSLDKAASYAPVGDIWTNCTKPSDEGQIISVIISPAAPKKGDTVTVQATFMLKENVTKGQIAVKAALDGIDLLNQNFDLCDVAEEADLKCPIAAGQHSIKVSATIPEIAPKGEYTAHATVMDQNNKEIACADGKYKLE